ncbi:MAG: DEAD/DEAH box helicase [Ignavibacteriales bacterium]|nr:DEAD/DEAH box helicase [Ignavibacteriales bacterium]
MENIKEFFISKNWNIVSEIELPPKNEEKYSVDKLNLCKYSGAALQSIGNNLYKHQIEALKQLFDKNNICMTTSTASGKSLVFYLAAIEKLNLNPNARILAIYPLRALCTEQEVRWKKIINESGLDVSIDKIDGGVHITERIKKIKNSRIIIVTPDIIHAWLLSNINDKNILNFFKNLELVIVDEAHVYSGVFGSNSAFLFRRINHVVSKLSGKIPQYISASATMHKPFEHLEKLIGLDFKIIGEEFDTAPRNKTNIILADPPIDKDTISSFSELLKFSSEEINHKFIAFVDSRKQTEYLASISARQTEKDDVDNFDIDGELLDQLKIVPYRSGYEEIDRTIIQTKLSLGELKGVISTSALEMGIDINFLSLGILLGVPSSATSFLQRIGRIGRHSEGVIIIVNNGSFVSEGVFRDPDKLLKMPLRESSLYLENQRIQYIHALCLARDGGEDDIINREISLTSDKFSSEVTFPDNFINLCNSERIGEVSAEFQNMKAQSGNDPNHLYPLRDIEVQYKVEMKRGPNLMRLGSLTFSQLMREAYPGAVYYYKAQSYRVYRVNTFKHLVEVRKEKKYTTKAINLPTLIFPNLSEGNIHSTLKKGNLIILECNLQIRESIIGYKERRGPNEFNIDYPLDANIGSYFDQPRFTRNYFTTGIIINHPSLKNDKVKTNILAEILFEAFLMTIPFERQDVNFGSDKHRTERDFFYEGDKFLSIFDQTYGSLRLTSRLLEEDILNKVFEEALKIISNDNRFELNVETKLAIKEIITCFELESENIIFGENKVNYNKEGLELVILPGSSGLDLKRGNEEFFIDNVVYNSDFEMLVYAGRHLSQQGAKWDTATITVPIKNVIEIPGVTRLGWYDLKSGQISRHSTK